MFIHILGGCPGMDKEGITPNGIVVQDGLNILVDPGMGHETLPDKKQKALHINLRALNALGKIDYIILSHSHLDHSGLVPLLMKMFPMAVLVCTRPTFYIVRHSWYDAALVGRRHYPGLLPFNTALYQEMGRRAILLDRPGWVPLKNGARVNMMPNGHGRGSASLAIEIGGKLIVFSADVSTNDLPTVLGMREENVPADIRGADLMFLESTLGDRSTVDRVSEIAKMNQAILETRALGGNTLAAALGVERAQDILIDQARVGTTSFLDGRLACNVWDAYQEPESFWCDNDVAIEKGIVRQVKTLTAQEQRELILKKGRPISVVSSGGALQGGPSVFWAEKFLSGRNNLVCLCNYQFKGTPGHYLQQHGTGCVLDLNGKKIVVRARVMRVEASAHVGADELLRVRGGFNPRRTVAYHGEYRARKALSQRAGGTIELPVDGDIIEL